MNNQEIWRPVVGYEGLYEVSNYGKVRSLDRWIKAKHNSTRLIKGGIRKTQISIFGYAVLLLGKNGSHKGKAIHRLVAEAFLPNPNNLPEVNHKDENKTNNFVYVNSDGIVDPEKSNLEWCDRVYNCNYGTFPQKMSMISRKKVLQYDANGTLVNVYQRLMDVEKEGFCSVYISRACHKNIMAYGFKWQIAQS